LKIGPDGKVEPNLAQSVKQPNPFTYIYALRRGVKFWDGSELTSDDVVNALNYQRYPQFTVAPRFASVRSIVARDRYTVVVTLKHRDASWIYKLAWTGQIFEKKFADEHKGTMGNPGVGIMG